jgi:hypothetical protein
MVALGIGSDGKTGRTGDSPNLNQLEELRARCRNEVRVSGFHRGPQRKYQLQLGRI